MCGRYALALSNEELYDSLEARLPRLFQNGRPRWERSQDHHGSYNVAPRQRAPVIRRDPENNENAIVETMQWGLIPHWTKHPPSGGLNTINARSEGLLDSSSGGMWHALKGYKRCVVPAQGYYEWLKKPSTKIPHFTRLPLEKGDTVDHPPILFFAGLYDIVKYVSPVASSFVPSTDPEDKREPYPTGNPLPLATFTILTTEPTKDLRWLHDRMPCILTDWDQVARWLDLGEVKGWEEGKAGTGVLLKGTAGLDCYAVPNEVGKIGNNSPTFIQPVSERSDGIKSFFQKQTSSPTKPKKEVKQEEKTTTEKQKVKTEKAEEENDHSGPVKVKDDGKPITPEKKSIKEEAEGIETRLKGNDKEKDIGDDSNAPNTRNEQGDPNDKKAVKHDAEAQDLSSGEVEVIDPPRGKRKRNDNGKGDDDDHGGQDDEREDDEEKKTVSKKGGHQTKVVRRNVDDGQKAQPAITAFFGSPSTCSKTKNQTLSKTKTRVRGP
ncbi:hypothetical protein I316_03097 [Kwoniella heveanensis BCC8398]|uniref:DUF159-domain-containing protein n=1 Tax=Kwoniella heveanensis BCC8398 TaxID=1296120 RepID=A0A1B9GVI4_9TREE|nr:hypothetical protein I316_03097 [Kwoniella heveanensis BCC8398]